MIKRYLEGVTATEIVKVFKRLPIGTEFAIKDENGNWKHLVTIPYTKINQKHIADLKKPETNKSLATNCSGFFLEFTKPHLPNKITIPGFSTYNGARFRKIAMNLSDWKTSEVTSGS